MGYSETHAKCSKCGNETSGLSLCIECSLKMPLVAKPATFLWQKECNPVPQVNADFSITEVCPHDIAEIKVIESITTCETTQLVCSQCGEPLEPPKTEC